MEEEGRNGFRTVQWIRLKISSRGGSYRMEYLYVGYTVVQIGILSRENLLQRGEKEKMIINDHAFVIIIIIIFRYWVPLFL